MSQTATHKSDVVFTKSDVVFSKSDVVFNKSDVVGVYISRKGTETERV